MSVEEQATNQVDEIAVAVPYTEFQLHLLPCFFVIRSYTPFRHFFFICRFGTSETRLLPFRRKLIVSSLVGAPSRLRALKIKHNGDLESGYSSMYFLIYKLPKLLSSLMKLSRVHSLR